MADEKYSALTDGGGLAAADEFAVARAGASVRVSPIGVPVLVYRYTVVGADKASIDTGVDTPDAGSNDWTNCDLIEVFLKSRTDDTGTNPGIGLVLNNDSGSFYDYQWDRLFATSSSNVNSVNNTELGMQTSGGGVANTTIFGAAQLAFQDPTGAVTSKPFLGMFGYTDPGDSSQNEIVDIQGSYHPTTPAALTRLKAAPDTVGKKFKIGSQLLIYKRLAS